MSINNIADILAEIKHKHGISSTMTKEEWQQEKINRYNNSEGDMNEQDGYDCRLCKNKGMIARIDEQGNEVYTLCKCRKIREMLKRAKRSGLGDVIRDCTFDKFETAEQWQSEIKSKAQAFCKDDNANWFYIGGQVGCVDCDTEYFNGKEWVRIADYKQGDKVLQYDPKTKTGILTIPKRYITAPSNELYQIEGKRRCVDMCLSENHNFAYITTKGHMRKKPFSEVMKMHNETVQGFYGKIETAFIYNGGGINLTDNEIRLMCAVIADGYFAPKQQKCRVSVKKERKKERMRILLKETPYKEYKRDNGYSVFIFYAPRKEKEFTDFWYKCNQEQLKIIAEEVFEWDGHKGGERRSFYSTSKKSADFVQFALSATGHRATIGVDTHKEKPCYVVIKSSYSSAIHICATGGKNKASIKKVIPKDGKQYCFTVETGYLIFRRNGRIFITGNSGKSHICTAIAAYYIKAGKEVRYMIWAEEAKRLKAIVNDSSYGEMIQRYKDVDVLYIDDFLKVKFGETPTAADINLAFEIINHRLLSNNKITIISSEKRLDEIMEYDEATMSRIYKETGAYKINIGKDINKNYRLKG